MEQVHENMSQLEDRLQKLLARYNQQKVTIVKLKEENEKLKSLKPKKLDNISQNAHTVQALVEHLGTDPKKQEIKTLLTEYMKQLDTCIAFLEKTCSDASPILTVSDIQQ